MSFFGNRRQIEEMGESMDNAPQNTRPVAAPLPVGFETVLGANCSMEGVLRSHANVRLDGTFTGTLEIEGNVLVGETAKIEADIDAKNISIAGAVRGNVSGKKVQLLRTGRIWGDIRALALTTEEGAFIDGKITMVGHEANQSPDNEPAFVQEIAEPNTDSPAEDAPDLSLDDDEASETDETDIVDDTPPGA